MSYVSTFKELEKQKQINWCTYTHIASLPHLGPRVLDYASRIIPASIGRLSLSIWVPEYWGMYTSRRGHSIEIGTFSQYWGVHSASRIIPHSIGKYTQNAPTPSQSRGRVTEHTFSVETGYSVTRPLGFWKPNLTAVSPASACSSSGPVVGSLLGCS